MSPGKAIVLNCENFDLSSSNLFKKLRKESNFYDVALGCTDSNGRLLQAHKVIVSAFSSVLKDMITQDASINSKRNSSMFLRGISYQDLSSILDFIYQGEVCVNEERLASFLSVAEDLKIDGLSNIRISFKENTAKPLNATSSVAIGSDNYKKVRYTSEKENNLQLHTTLPSLCIIDDIHRSKKGPKIKSCYKSEQVINTDVISYEDVNVEYIEGSEKKILNDTSENEMYLDYHARDSSNNEEGISNTNERTNQLEISKKKRKSGVWTYFTNVCNERRKVMCILCEREMKLGTNGNIGTTTMWRHLKKKHTDVFPESHAVPTISNDAEIKPDIA